MSNYGVSTGEICTGIVANSYEVANQVDLSAADDAELEDIVSSGTAPAEPQIVYLDFDGEKDATYRNSAQNIIVEDITVKETGLTEDRIYSIVSDLNENFADRNITFVSERPSDGKYSTVYVGKTNAFDEYGEFLGLAETIDSGNKIKDDNAFVMLDASSSNDEIVSVISHEIGHIAEGKQHDVTVNALDDFASFPTPIWSWRKKRLFQMETIPYSTIQEQLLIIFTRLIGTRVNSMLHFKLAT